MSNSFYKSNIECLSGGRNSFDAGKDNIYIPKQSTIAEKKAQMTSSFQTKRFGQEGGAHDLKIKCAGNSFVEKGRAKNYASTLGIKPTELEKARQESLRAQRTS